MSAIFNESMFEYILAYFGTNVTVITKTPEIDEHGEVVYGDDDKIVYEETTTNNVRVRILENTGNEQLWNNTIKQSATQTGLFRLSDADKLNNKSRIIYNGTVLFMQKPRKRFTHYEVPLEEKEM